MAFPINGDLLPVTSGFSSLGVGVDSNGQNAFDANNIRPFNRYHVLSGVYHDPLNGQSGVIRFNQAAGAFQVSVDGGATFNSISAGGSVTSVGIIGGANLTGNIDLASVSSGFISITDNGGSSPVFIGVNTYSLSGLWGFPTNGFSNMAKCYSQTVSPASTNWTISHNLNTTNVSVSVYDNGTPQLAVIPDQIRLTDANTVNVRFNVAQAGKVVIIGC